MIGVYKITNLITGDFYIGQSRNAKKRMYNHRYPGIHGERFETDIRKYGWENFSFDVIEECQVEDLKEREAYFIETLRPTYNEIVRGRKRKPETVEKMRAAATGRKQSPESIEKLKLALKEYRKSHPQTNEGHRKKIITESNLHFDSVKDTAEFFGVHPSSVTKALKRHGKVNGVRVWYEV